MADTLLTPGVGGLSLSGKFGLPQLPPYQANGTDVSAGARLPPYQLPGASVSRTDGAAALSFAGLAPTILNSASPSYVAQPGVASLVLSGLAPTVTVLGLPVAITPAVVAVTFTGYSPSLFATNSLALLLRTISASGGPGFDANFILPLRTLAATGTMGIVGSVEFTAPLRTIFVTGQDGAAFVTPRRTLVASGVLGVVGSAAFETPLRSLSANATVSVSATASFTTPLRVLSATGMSSILGAASFATPRRTLSATAYAGIVANAAPSLLLRTLDTNGYPQLIGNLSITGPLRYITASGFTSPTETYRTWVMNVRTGSLVEYDNYEFNSMVKFGDHYLGAGAGGLFVLGGETDDGDEIDSTLRTGLDGFGETFLKRVPRIYWQGNQEGDLHFTTITTEDGRRTYALIDNAIRGEQQRRVPVGKGPKAVRWQFEVTNRRGANFGVSEIMVYPQNLRRRIQ